jgi:hypothetical protein
MKFYKQTLALLNVLILLVVLSGCTTVRVSPVDVRYQEGVAEGFVTVSSLDGKKLGEGEVTQLAAGIDRVASRLSLRFVDGSWHDERVVFSQKGQFKLVNYTLVQQGPSFSERVHVSLDMETSTYVLYRNGPSDEQTVLTGHLDLPLDTYNGMTVTLLKNLEQDASATVHMLDFQPEPKLYTVDLIPIEKDAVRAGGLSRDAVHYVLKPKLRWFMENLASWLGKLPPPYHFWLLKGKVPAFVRFEGPLYANGPMWRIEQASPKLRTGK